MSPTTSSKLLPSVPCSARCSKSVFFLLMMVTLLLAAPGSRDAVVSASPSSSSSSSSNTLFVKNGDMYTLTNRQNLDLYDELPTGTYTIGLNQMTGQYYLQTIDDFVIEGKIYGDTEKQAERILNTFLDRCNHKMAGNHTSTSQQKSSSTGVLLSGEKGSGKTFLAKWVSIQAAKQYNISTIVINQPHHGERFNQFIASIPHPTIVLFDEYEKVYTDTTSGYHPHFYGDEEVLENLYGSSHRHHRPDIPHQAQDALLTLLDGVYTSQMLYILTTNNRRQVTSNMMNRPGRIYYMIHFSGVSTTFIREYCDDNLHDRTMTDQVVAVSMVFDVFNFDMLKAMIEEMNRYGETPQQVLKYLNVSPESSSGLGTKYEIVSFSIRGHNVPKRNIHSGPDWYGNPLFNIVQIHYQPPGRNHRGTKHYHSSQSSSSSSAVRGRNLEEDEEEMEHSGETKPTETDSTETQDFSDKQWDDDDQVYLEDNEDYFDGDMPGRVEFTIEHIERADMASGTYWYWNPVTKARLVLRKSTRSFRQSLADINLTDFMTAKPTKSTQA